MKDEVKIEKVMKNCCCITPYLELRCGDESIYDYVRKDYSVPDKVIKYLQTQKLYYMCPGIYQHPFREGVRLLGPYVYTDGYYYWDRDTWKYVLKYGLVLPQEFVDHVMSDESTAFIDEYYGKTWRFKERENLLNLLPDDHGDVDLNDF